MKFWTKMALFFLLAAFSSVSATEFFQGPHFVTQLKSLVNSPLNINSAVAGNQPDPVSVSTTYYMTVPFLSPTQKLTGVLSKALTVGKLQVTLGTPQYGGTSMGTVTLSTTSQDLLRNIPANPFSDSARTNAVGATYTFSATVADGTLSTTLTTVTITIMNQ